MHFKYLCMNACHKERGEGLQRKEEKAPGWSVEETKEKPNIAVVEDTGDMKNEEV